MKKGTLKKLISATMLATLLSTTAVYAEDVAEGGVKFEFNLSPIESEYSKLVKKTNSAAWAVVEQQGPASGGQTIEYTVVNKNGYRKSKTGKAYGVTTIQVSYGTYTVGLGDEVKLQGYNNPTNNQGYSCGAYGYFTP